MARFLEITGWADAEERRIRGISNGRPSARSPGAASVVILALVLTVLNAIKPLRIDDNHYLAQARQIAKHPSDPYGYLAVGTVTYPQQVFKMPHPPVLTYYLALPVRVFGPQLFLIKLALLPFALVFVFAMHTLLSRYTPGLVGPLLWMTALGPVILPTLNLMLDVPEMALGLSSVALFTHAHSRQSAGLAALAGVVAGLAAETKWTGFVLPGVFLAHAVTHRGWARWVIATVATAAVFVGVETLIALRYGESHFLYNLARTQPGTAGRETMAIYLLEMVGGLAPAVSLIALAGLRLPYRMVAKVGFLIAAGYVLLGFVPGRMHSPQIAWAFFTVLGLLFIGTMIATASRLLVWRSPLQTDDGEAWRDDWFLVLWFALEVVAYFAISPFPGYRRFLGIVIAGTFLAGRLASRTCRSPESMGLVRGAAVGGVVLGFFLYGVDSCEAIAIKRVVQDATTLVRSKAAPNSEVWYFAHWAACHYLEMEGFQFINAGRSRLRAGDWVIQVEGYTLVQLPEEFARPTARLEASDFIPWKANPLVPVPGGGPLLMRRFKGAPRAIATVYRVEKDFIAPDFPPELRHLYERAESADLAN